MSRNRLLLWLIIFITAFSIWVDLPKLNLDFAAGPLKIQRVIGGNQIDFDLFGFRFKRKLEIKKGLDLQGGLSVVLKARMDQIPENERVAALDSAKEVISRRVNFLGVSEPNIYTSRQGDEYRINVELPGVIEPEQALSLIGQTAQLDFRELPSEEPMPDQTQASFVETNLSGRDLKRALVVFNPTTGQPQVQLIFTDEGAKKFKEITQRNIDKPLAIYLDNKLVTAPRVQEVIAGGEAVITGQFTVQEAKTLAIQLNAGALPAPVEVIKRQTIGPTLGQESVNKSIFAGSIGLLLVALFMILIYKRLGVLATIALIIYGLITLALYMIIPVTLTLPGIAGFILSVGMAVDSNILIFERMKEEIRWGRPLGAAMELGFGRAWDSIRDANAATLITVFVLFNPFGWSFLVTSGMVRGFALTLGLGILISLFTGIVVTRTLIRVFYK